PVLVEDERGAHTVIEDELEGVGFLADAAGHQADVDPAAGAGDVARHQGGDVDVGGAHVDGGLGAVGRHVELYPAGAAGDRQAGDAQPATAHVRRAPAVGDLAIEPVEDVRLHPAQGDLGGGLVLVAVVVGDRQGDGVGARGVEG